jgi:hypothetical protein
MKRIINTLDKAYVVEWAPTNVCALLRENAISADKLVQSNKFNTKRLIKDFFLLACRASLSTSETEIKKAATLSNYANAIKRISNDYENLFRRQEMVEAVSETDNKSEVMEDSAINNIDRMQARLFYLTTQFSVHPCTHLAGHIVELLTSLCKHPHIELLPAQHYIYSQSLNYWRSRLINNCAPKNQAELH